MTQCSTHSASSRQRRQRGKRPGCLSGQNSLALGLQPSPPKSISEVHWLGTDTALVQPASMRDEAHGGLVNVEGIGPAGVAPQALGSCRSLWPAKPSPCHAMPCHTIAPNTSSEPIDTPYFNSIATITCDLAAGRVGFAP